jgi:hypothetical protein
MVEGEVLTVKVMIWKRRLFLRPNPPIFTEDLLGKPVTLRVLSPRDLEGVPLMGVIGRYPGKSKLCLVVLLSRRWYLADLQQYRGRTLRVRVERVGMHG